MGMGDLAAEMSMDVSPWAASFKEANSVLDGFSERFSSTIATVQHGSQQIGAVATTAAISIGSIGVGLVAIGSKGGALFGVARTLLGIGGIATGLSTAIKNLRSGTTYFQKIVGSIGAVGAAAGIAALAIRGISYAMQQAGKDTTKIDSIGVTLGRVATAATVAILGIKGISLAVRTMQSVAGAGLRIVATGFRGLQATVMALPATIGMVGSALRRMGSVGIGAFRSGASAIGSFAANAGDALGAIGQGVASVAVSFAAGGIIGGLAAGIGLLVAAGASMQSLGIAGTAAEGPLTSIRNTLNGIGAWLAKIGSGIGTVALNSIAEAAARGQRYFDAFLEATQPLTDAIQNVWLPAVIGGTDGATSAFSGFFDYIETNWGAWISDSISALSEFIGNFDIYFQMAQQNIVLFASNSILRIGDFFNNIGTWLNWFGKNWSDVLFSAGDLAATVFINIGENIREIFAEIWDWVSSGFTDDIEIDWKGLTKGFASTIKEWPKLIETELADTSPELEGLSKQLADRQTAAKSRGLGISAIASTVKTEESASAKTATVQQSANKAVLQGSSEAAAAFTRGLGGGGKTKTESLLEKQIVATNQVAAAVKDSKPEPMKVGKV